MITKGTFPKIQLILDYKIYFGTVPPDDRISFIKHIGSYNVIVEIAGLNYRLKPDNEVHIDESLETQIRELKYFTKTDALYKAYAKTAIRYTNNKNDYPNIFNRQACLFAIEEIVNSAEIKPIENFQLEKIEDWEAILKYLLAVNYTITQIKEEKDDDKASFETLNPKLLPLNEQTIQSDQIFVAHRGYCLINYFLANKTFSADFKDYFIEKYGCEAYKFLFELLCMYMANDPENKNLGFYYQVPEAKHELFEILSSRTLSHETYKLINIRKSPFIKIDKYRYLLIDKSFLLEKTYSQLLNDFWFDHLKGIKIDSGETKFSIRLYWSEFGYFFENYISKIIHRSFENYKYSKLLMFNQLKVKVGKNEIEIADVYLRYGNKILLAQVKSGFIYDNEKYGGTKEALYKNDRSKFFKDFGVDQLIGSLTQMNSNMVLLDEKFPKGHSYYIYPCLIVNDNVLQTLFMPNIFNNRFQELVKGFNIDKVKVKKLIVIHINDLKNLENFLVSSPGKIWELLEYNQRNKNFIPPFYATVNSKTPKRKRYPLIITEMFNSLYKRYNNID